MADPTYMIRAIPSNASDNVYCTLLAHSAIHGAMAGYSFTVGMVNGRHAYIPFHVSTNFCITLIFSGSQIQTYYPQQLS
jgi:6-phosphofructokinase 1